MLLTVLCSLQRFLARLNYSHGRSWYSTMPLRYLRLCCVTRRGDRAHSFQRQSEICGPRNAKISSNPQKNDIIFVSQWFLLKKQSNRIPDDGRLYRLLSQDGHLGRRRSDVLVYTHEHISARPSL